MSKRVYFLVIATVGLLLTRCDLSDAPHTPQVDRNGVTVLKKRDLVLPYSYFRVDETGVQLLGGSTLLPAGTISVTCSFYKEKNTML